MKKSIQEKMENRKEFINIRQYYIDTANKSSDFFDKTLITLSTSILWWSMIFINANSHNLIFSWFVLVARILLWITMLITLISFVISENAHWLSQEKWDLEYIKDENKVKEKEIIEKLNEIETKINNKNKLIKYIKYISIVTLFLWVVFLIVFIYININNMKEISKKTISNSWQNFSKATTSKSFVISSEWTRPVSTPPKTPNTSWSIVSVQKWTQAAATPPKKHSSDK